LAKLTDSIEAAKKLKNEEKVTGDWRSRRPIYDFTKCIKCAICQVYCPEGCIEENAEGYYQAGLYHCKGCGICAKECPTKVISMVEEKE
jgi:pyruvate ferredoxin oxidoreductase delta subunit